MQFKAVKCILFEKQEVGLFQKEWFFYSFTLWSGTHYLSDSKDGSCTFNQKGAQAVSKESFFKTFHISSFYPIFYLSISTDFQLNFLFYLNFVK